MPPVAQHALGLLIIQSTSPLSLNRLCRQVNFRIFHLLHINPALPPSTSPCPTSTNLPLPPLSLNKSTNLSLPRRHVQRARCARSSMSGSSWRTRRERRRRQLRLLKMKGGRATEGRVARAGLLRVSIPKGLVGGLYRHRINHCQIIPILKENPISHSTCELLGALSITPMFTGYKKARSSNIFPQCLDWLLKSLWLIIQRVLSRIYYRTTKDGCTPVTECLHSRK